MTLETKMQIDALKILEKGSVGPAAFAEDENFVYLTVNGCCAYRIPKPHFFLNCDFLKPVASLASSFSSLALDHTCELTVTDDMRVLTQKGDIVRTLKGDNFYTYINVDCLKKFSVKGCKLYAKSNKSAIYFVTDSEIYAVVMPTILPNNGAKPC